MSVILYQKRRQDTEQLFWIHQVQTEDLSVCMTEPVTQKKEFLLIEML